MEAKNNNTSTVKNIILGFQHLLAMYSGDILIPLLVGASLGFNATQMTYLISADIFMCGVATLLQLKRTPLTGIGLPVVLGSAVEYVTPLQNIGKNHGIAYMYGAIIITGICIFLVAGVFSKLKRFFPPVVTGSLITLIGFTLIPVAFQNIGGGNVNAPDFGNTTNLWLGFTTVAIIVCINIFGQGFLKQISVLIGIVVMSFVALAIGKIGLEPVSTAHWFQIPRPFYFAAPKFEWSSILVMLLAALTCMIESTGVFFALGEITEREISEEDLKKGYRAEGIAAVFGGIFNTFPYSTFSQNVGVVELSGIKSIVPVFYSAVMLMVLGLIPKVGAIATLIPSAVLGGAMLVMFGIVGAEGVKMLSKIKMTSNNLLIIGVSIGLGLGVTVQPTLLQALPATAQTILNNGLVVGSFTAIILNLFLNVIMKKEIA
ncbi:xanthine permease [Companilactobacillus sp. RD055328]|uniref:nucleobase:cation symporter-2 family protein n=1 Tax=Companilactobacillus sp. RD055328 TaxID=2916634 RepID=UPI001FC80099|nr:nucleobase:cation symporter-2 family protein [Companilactobacillus sp. RD055328]GKQ43290.1 xanthine permease [Companilactobacillus sp. RD055328]